MYCRKVSQLCVHLPTAFCIIIQFLHAGSGDYPGFLNESRFLYSTWNVRNKCYRSNILTRALQQSKWYHNLTKATSEISQSIIRKEVKIMRSSQVSGVEGKPHLLSDLQYRFAYKLKWLAKVKVVPNWKESLQSSMRGTSTLIEFVSGKANEWVNTWWKMTKN